jgi:hypothetical protein
MERGAAERGAAEQLRSEQEHISEQRLCKMAKNKQKDMCLAYNKALTKSDASIQCVMCGLWVHHKPCSQVSDDGFKFLSEQIQATGYAYWGCRSCVSYA